VPTKRAKLTVRTYDTFSSTTLWFHTGEGKEMSQIMRMLADLGTSMAGKERNIKVEEADAVIKKEEGSTAAELEIRREDIKSAVKEEPRPTTGGGGKKKKKGGKR